MGLVTYNNLTLLPEVERSRSGRPLAMDYDESHVIILKPLFVTYSGVPSGNDAEFIYRIEGELLHEAGHLFGLDELQSADFSYRIMSRLQARVIFSRHLGYYFKFASDGSSCFFRLSRSGDVYTFGVVDWQEFPYGSVS